MKNHWINRKKKNEDFKSRQHMGEIKTNHQRVDLVWDEIYEEEMPILRADYVDMAAAFHIYRTELEHASGVCHRSLMKG